MKYGKVPMTYLIYSRLNENNLAATFVWTEGYQGLDSYCMDSSCDPRGAIDHNQPMEVQNEDEGIVRFSLDLGSIAHRCILEVADALLHLEPLLHLWPSSTLHDYHSHIWFWNMLNIQRLLIHWSKRSCMMTCTGSLLQVQRVPNCGNLSWSPDFSAALKEIMKTIPKTQEIPCPSIQYLPQSLQVLVSRNTVEIHTKDYKSIYGHRWSLL